MATMLEIVDVSRFDHPSDEMPEGIAEMVRAGMVAYRYRTDDERVAWVPAHPQLLDDVEDVRSLLRAQALAALHKLDEDH